MFRRHSAATTSCQDKKIEDDVPRRVSVGANPARSCTPLNPSLSMSSKSRWSSDTSVRPAFVVNKPNMWRSSQSNISTTRKLSNPQSIQFKATLNDVNTTLGATRNKALVSDDLTELNQRLTNVFREKRKETRKQDDNGINELENWKSKLIEESRVRKSQGIKKEQNTKKWQSHPIAEMEESRHQTNDDNNNPPTPDRKTNRKAIDAKQIVPQWKKKMMAKKN